MRLLFGSAKCDRLIIRLSVNFFNTR